VSIRDKIGLRLALDEHYPKYLPMTFRGMNETNTRLVNPALDSRDCLFHGQRLFKYLPVRANPDE
jgi:hypothetical protein